MESQAAERVYADLVSALTAARADPATERFDRELDSAVARGEVSAPAAQTIRFWQRAALRACGDYHRTVLPAVLAALETWRDDAETALGATDAVDHGEIVGVVAEPDTPGPASVITLPPSINLEEPRQRLLLAGLVPAGGPTAPSR